MFIIENLLIEKLTFRAAEVSKHHQTLNKGRADGACYALLK